MTAGRSSAWACAEYFPRVLACPRLGGSPVDALAHPDGAVDQLAKRGVVHIVEALEVQAAFSRLVRAEPGQHRPVSIGELADQVDGQVLAARREAGQRRVPLVAAGVPVVVAAKTDDSGPPH